MTKYFLFFSELTLNPPEGIIAGPINEENFFEWEALITYVIVFLIQMVTLTHPLLDTLDIAGHNAILFH